MKMRIIAMAAAILAATFAAPSATFAAEQLLTFDPDASEVAISLAATGHDIEGFFHLREGSVRFDTETGTASGEVIVEAGGVTGNAKRDNTMHKKVLESQDFPYIVFRPDSIQGDLPATGEGDVTLHGTMTLVGSDHPMVMKAHVEVEGDHLKAVTSFDLPYVEWGLHDPSIFILKVAKQVGVEIIADGTLTASDSAALGESSR